MKCSLTDKTDCEVLVVCTWEDKKSVGYNKYASKQSFEALIGETRLVTTKGKGSDVLLVGLGEHKDYSLARYLSALELGVRQAGKLNYKHVGVLVMDVPSLSHDQAVARTTEATIITARIYDAYRQETLPEVRKLSRASIIVNKLNAADKQSFKQALVVSEAVNTMRDLQDTPAMELYPASMAAEAKKMAAKYKLKCTILDEKMLAKKKYNTILAVGAGSSRKPRMVTLEYRHPKAKRTICLVGKGVTFDTGGYNLKPTGFMENMKHDMSGSALVFAVLQAVAQLKPKINVVGVLGLAENMISGDAYRPSDIIRTPAGITVEVGNTDAEGRLVLADALFHANTFKPDAIVDFATLTGACVIALGSVCSAILGNDEELVESIIARGHDVGERLWPLPLLEEYEFDLESKIADVKSMGYKREAGTITAAAFLKLFVGKTKWAHLDIAGTAMVERPRHFTEWGGTGWGVRTMVEWLQKL